MCRPRGARLLQREGDDGRKRKGTAEEYGEGDQKKDMGFVNMRFAAADALLGNRGSKVSVWGELLPGRSTALGGFSGGKVGEFFASMCAHLAVFLRLRF